MLAAIVPEPATLSMVAMLVLAAVATFRQRDASRG
jgi:hypothetical protein